MPGRRLRWGLVAVALIAAAGFAGQNFLRVRMKPKAPEWRTNLAALRTAELAHFAEFDTYVAAAPVPAQVPRGKPVPWPLDSEAVHGFNTLGFAPRDATRCSYAVATDEASFTAVAVCDPWDRGEPIAWAYVGTEPGATSGVQGPFGRCSADGVWSARRGRVLNQVGPCDEASAREVPY